LTDIVRSRKGQPKDNKNTVQIDDKEEIAQHRSQSRRAKSREPESNIPQVNPPSKKSKPRAPKQEKEEVPVPAQRRQSRAKSVEPTSVIPQVKREPSRPARDEEEQIPVPPNKKSSKAKKKKEDTVPQVVPQATRGRSRTRASKKEETEEVPVPASRSRTRAKSEEPSVPMFRPGRSASRAKPYVEPEELIAVPEPRNPPRARQPSRREESVPQYVVPLTNFDKKADEKAPKGGPEGGPFGVSIPRKGRSTSQARKKSRKEVDDTLNGILDYAGLDPSQKALMRPPKLVRVRGQGKAKAKRLSGGLAPILEFNEMADDPYVMAKAPVMRPQ
jgi:hypothetical protein